MRVIILLAFLYPEIAMSQSLSTDAAEFADKHFFRESLIDLLYDNDLDFEQHFQCESVMFKRSDRAGGFEATCFTDDVFILHIKANVDSKGRPNRVYVCPDDVQGRLPNSAEIDKIKLLAIDREELENATMFFMGYSRSWLRKFVNILVENEDSDFFCWELLRR